MTGALTHLRGTYRLEKAERVALAVIAALVAFQYSPLFRDGFPVEPETRAFFSSIRLRPWSTVLWYKTHYTIFPLLNIVLKVAAHLHHLHPSLFFSALLTAHLGIIWTFLALARRIGGRLAASLGIADAEGFGKRAGILAALLFSVSGPYYHLLANPSAVTGVLPAYALLLFWALLLLSAPEKESPALRRLSVCVAAIIPLFFLVSIVFMATAALLFILIGADRPAVRATLRRTVVAHLAVLACQILLVDGRFTSFSVVSCTSDFTPDRFGLAHNLRANPAEFALSTLYTAVAGVLYGLAWPCFILDAPPYSLPYCVGAAFLLAFLAAAFRLGTRGLAWNAALWLVVLATMVNVCVMRNPLSGELDRVFDAYYVASQPRYYYFPAMAWALAVGGTLAAARERLPRRAWALLGCSVLAVFLLSSAIRTRSKVRYLERHMSDEIYRYTPKGLRPPESEPGHPSWRKGNKPPE